MATPEMTATGVVSPDISRTVPVISLASGRIVEIHARLGGHRHQGPIAAASSELGYLVGLFRLPEGDQERTTD